MVRWATKDPSEKEEEEVERNVRKSPSDKAPRPDKERRRIEVEDSDIEDDDKDLSMNYKDIGGSVASWVASAYLNRVAIDFATENALNTYMEEHPDADPSNHTVDGEPADKVLDTSKSKPKEKPDSKPDTQLDATTEEAVERVQSMDMDALYDAAETGTPEEQAAAVEVITQRKKPLPPGMPESSSFAGELDMKAVESLQEQIKHWDALDYNQNMFELETDYAMAQRSGNERDADYFKAIMDVYEGSSSAVRTKNLRDVEDPSELLEDIDMDAPAEELDSRQLQKKKRGWYQSAMFSPLNVVGDLLESVESLLEESPEGTQGATYLEEMASLLTDVRDRKMFDQNVSSDRLLSSIRDDSSPALQELDPGNFDFTDPKEVDDFMSKVENLGSADIARMVKDEPLYLMHFSFDPNTNPDEVSITDREKRSFMNALRQDLAIRGTFEQVRFHDDDTNQMFDKGSILEFREQAMQELQAQGIDLSDPGSVGRHRSFWDTFMDWADDLSAKTSHVDEARAIRAGITTALQTVRR